MVENALIKLDTILQQTSSTFNIFSALCFWPAFEFWHLVYILLLLPSGFRDASELS